MKQSATGKVNPTAMRKMFRGLLAAMEEVCRDRHDHLAAEDDAFHVQAQMAGQLLPFLKRKWSPGEAEEKAKTLIMLLHAQEHLQRQFIHLLKGLPLEMNDAEGCANYSIFALVVDELNQREAGEGFGAEVGRGGEIDS